MTAHQEPSHRVGQDQDPQRLTLRVSLDDAMPEEFVAFRVPRDLQVEASSLKASLVEALDVSATLELEAGQHEIPIAGAEPLVVTVEEGCRAKARFVAGPTDGGQSETRVEEGEIRFDPPVSLSHVFSTLVGLPTIFEDHGVSAAIGASASAAGRLAKAGRKVGRRAKRIAGRALRPNAKERSDEGAERARVRSQVGKGFVSALTTGRDVVRDLVTGKTIAKELSAGRDVVKDLIRRSDAPAPEGGEQVVQIQLRRATLSPDSSGLSGRLRFSGDVVCAGRYPVPFADVRLPEFIIPAPHLQLERLASAQPLASARLYTERISSEAVGRAILGALVSCQGHAKVRGTPPEVVVEARLADHGQLRLSLPPDGVVQTEAEFSCQLGAESLELSVSQTLSLGNGMLATELEARGMLRESAGTEQVRASRREPGPEVESRRRAATNGSGDGGEGSAGPGPEVESRRRAATNGSGDGWDGSAGPGPEVRAANVLIRAVLEGRFADLQERFDWDISGSVRTDAPLQRLLLGVHRHHPLTLGSTDLAMMLSTLKADGRFRLGSQDEPDEVRIDFTGGVEVDERSRHDDGRFIVNPKIEGHFNGEVAWGAGRALVVGVRGDMALHLDGRTDIGEFPELSFEESEATVSIEGRARFETRAEVRGEAHFDGSWVELHLDEAVASAAPLRLTIPAGTEITSRLKEGFIGVDGLGRSVVETSWDTQGSSPLLSSTTGEQTELLVSALRQGSIRVHVSPGGGLEITGDEGGLYDAHFFNALVNPAKEISRWIEILDDDEAVRHVQAAVRMLWPDLADHLDVLRRFERRVRGVFEEEGIDKPGDFLPGRTIARVLSRLLCETTELEDEVYPLVEQVTDGDGMDVTHVKRLLGDHLPDHEYDFELDRLLRWCALLLRPTEPLPPLEKTEILPLSEDPTHAGLLRGLPSAASIHKTVNSDEPLPERFSAQVAWVAPYLTLEQIEYVLERGRTDWRVADHHRLRYIRQLKRRVRLISTDYGGMAYAPQALAIAFFLGDVVTISRGERRRADPHPLLSDCLLGPEDVARLLQAGLTPIFQGRTVQLNQRLLLDYIFDRPPAFLLQVLAEMGKMTPRVLVGVLIALLELEQSQQRVPLDLVSILSERLEMEIPRRSEFMAGGRWAKLSYYEALDGTAKRILAQIDPYRAVKDHLITHRHPTLPMPGPVPEVERIASAARQAIANADAIAHECRFYDGPQGPCAAASEAYIAAFERCAALVALQPGAFTTPWFKAFWARNHEALVVRSVVNNHLEDVDDVRRWLAIRTGRSEWKGEQDLVEGVIEALYYSEEDKKRIASDPLVRLLIPAEPGPLNFTIVSAMGVVTEGEKGRELEETYKRLEEERGIKTKRAPTETMRSLEHNAEQIIKIVRDVDTPWGYVGYSQGCANGLYAESLLLGGTPEQQRLVAGLRCRNLLFSAINGSAHGTCGDWKFLRAMREGDRFLKHYQVLFSKQATDLALKAIRLAMDNREIVLGLAGMQSLSHQGIRDLFRKGQFKSTAPTSIVRGVVGEGTLPEALEMLSNMLTRQIESPLHDTQVALHEAVGHAAWIDNPQARVLERCDMGCVPQATHHWSTLLHETAFLKTNRDLELAIYDTPKDRHIFPWIEVNARFGIIGP